MTTLKISNDEIEDIIKIVKSLEGSGLLLKGVTETVQNEVKEQKGGLGTLGASLLGKILTDKGISKKRKGRGINRAAEGALATRQGRGVLRAGYRNNKIDF